MTENKFSNSEKTQVLKDKLVEARSDQQTLNELFQSMIPELLNLALNSTENPFVEEINDHGTIGGKDVAVVEQRMRPGEYSDSGFIANGQNLVDILEADQTLVANLGLTHRQVVEPLQIAFGEYVNRMFNKEREAGVFTFEFNNQKFRVEVIATRGFQETPFFDNADMKGHWLLCTHAGGTMTFSKEDGETLIISPLLIHLIRDYGFYEGEVPYRVSPLEIAEFFGMVEQPPSTE